MNIEIISAGAGSGKTYTLTERMVALLKGGVHPAGIFATTFTKKAAAELQERVRHKLLESGMTDAAAALGEALIGTVHSIGARLLQRFAFEAGVSPLVEIIADGDGQRLFNESLSQVLTGERVEAMNRLADRLGLTKKSYGDPFDWRRDIRDLTEVARANNFSYNILEISKMRSWASFERLLPPSGEPDPIVWNNRLSSAIDQTVAALEANETDGTKTTKDAIETLKNFQTQLKFRGELYWYEWVKIAKTNVGAKSRDLMESLQELALRHDEHPQFRSDIKGYIDLVFDIAKDALIEFEQYKKKRGLIDYTDMEAYVSRLLRNPSVRETLRGEIGLLLVDEFQDTSPIQLDIFLQLSGLAQHSIWVGDPKQSIYGFRGADPALMQAIIDACGGVKDENILKKSWRSRPDLVKAVNAVFLRAFPHLPPEQIALQPAREDPPGNELLPALHHWYFLSELDERKTPGSPWLENCIADQINLFLAQKPLIYQKNQREPRPIRPGDIAVLCRKNYACQQIADALHKAGLKASISRAGLFDTPEATLALACLKYLLSGSDALSAAEILLLTGGMTLEQMANHRLEYLYRQQLEPGTLRWAADNPYLKKLNELRSRSADLSVSEILGLVLEELDLRRVAVQMGNAHQRLDNLDSIRRVAIEYESACHRLHSAATLGGFLLWANELASAGLDWQGSGENEDAVKVLTYHRSKGLEYPVTICFNLDQNLKEQVWGINLESERETPDLADILGGRWLRFWVNPYSDQLGRTRLETALQSDPAWEIARKTALEEEARLLYVGLTRARDYLVFPNTPKGTKWLNRVFNHGDESIPTLDPHSSETPFYDNGMPVAALSSILYKPKDFAESEGAASTEAFHDLKTGRSESPAIPRLIDPYRDLPSGLELQWGEPEVWGEWLPFRGDYRPEMSKALQTLLSADLMHLPETTVLQLAKKQLELHELTEAISPEQAYRQMAAFQKFLDARFTAEERVARYPLEGWFHRRLLRVQADIFLENDHGGVLLAMAGFAEGMKKWKIQAQPQASVLAWAAALLRRQSGGETPECWVVFPLEGQAVRVYLSGF